MNNLIDSHCHLDLVLQKGTPLAEVINCMLENRVDSFVQIAADEESLQFARSNPEINGTTLFYTIGAHPGEAHLPESAKNLDNIETLKNDKRFVAVGEIGLDYYYGSEYKEEQKRVFRKYLEKAVEIVKPICIHTRDAHSDTLEFLHSYAPAHPILIHCFTGNADQMHDYLAAGCMISFSGIVTFKNAVELREAALQVPLDRLLVETDSPFLAPVPFRGKPNQPGLVKFVADFIADLKGVERETLYRHARENTIRFYRLPRGFLNNLRITKK